MRGISGKYKVYLISQQYFSENYPQHFLMKDQLLKAAT